jgi:hypothetical protein
MREGAHQQCQTVVGCAMGYRPSAVMLAPAPGRFSTTWTKHRPHPLGYILVCSKSVPIQ